MKNKRILLLLFIAILIVVVALFTMPSETEHRRELKTNIAEYARTYVNKELRKQDNLSFFLGSLVMSSDAIVETVIDRLVVIDIRNYGIFSLGYVELPDKDEKQHLVSIACFGKVFFLADYKDFEKE